MAALVIFLAFVVWQFLRSPLVDLLRITINSGMLALFSYRFVKVIRKPSALETYGTNRLVKTLHTLAVLFMWVGVVAMISLLFIKPITLVIFSGASEPLLGMGILFVYIGMAGILGVIGVFLFEISRFVGHFADEDSAAHP